jgi:hypothetical protein
MMNRELIFSAEAEKNLRQLESDPAAEGILRQVRKTLGMLETNIRHPSLNAHKYDSLEGPNGEEVFEAYAQNRTAGAFRIFFLDGPDRIEGKKRVPRLTIVAITPHP